MPTYILFTYELKRWPLACRPRPQLWIALVTGHQGIIFSLN